MEKREGDRTMDREKARQALQETAWTFAAFFGISFFGWISGWSELPNLEAAQAAIRAALLSAAGAAAKGALWYLTGTKVRRAEAI